MSDGTPPKPRGSCLGRLISLFAFAGVAGLAVATWFIWQPQDLSDIEGIGPAAANKRAPDLYAAMRNSVKGGYPMTISEEDLNLYLRQVLVPKQEGLLAKWVTLEGVCVRLQEGQAEIILQRKVFGRSFTSSMYLQVEQTVQLNGNTTRQLLPHGAIYVKDMRYPIYRGGHFGKLEVPQGFLMLVKPAFVSLGLSLEKEYENGFQEMDRFTFKEGKLILDPGGSDIGIPGMHPR